MPESQHSPSSREAIAARVRGLIAGRGSEVEATARRLGVSELALRMTVDDISPNPTLEVVAAIVREFGVDPTWLVTGEYDVATHRAAINGEQTPHIAAIKALGVARMTPTSSTAEPPSIPLEA